MSRKNIVNTPVPRGLPPNLSNWLREFSRPSEWFAVATFANSWQNSAASTDYAVGYYRDPMEVVHLRGAITTGTSGTVAFTLPALFRPNANIGCVCDGGFVLINSSGQVTPTFSYHTGSTAATIYLDSVAFRAEK